MAAPPCSISPINPVTEIRKTYTYCPLRIIYRRKLRNNAMQETWRTKKEWRCEECSCPRAQHPHITSIGSTHKLSECPEFMEFHSFTLLRFPSIVILIESLGSDNWSQPQCPPFFLHMKEFQTFNSITDYVSQSFSPWNILVPMKDKNSKIFRSLGPWTRKRIKYA